MTHFLLNLLNRVLGLVGLVVLCYGIVLILRTIYQHYRGQTIAAYQNQWRLGGQVSTMPPVLGALVMVGLGLVVLGLVLTGTWILIVNDLIRLGQLLSQSVQRTLTGSGGT